MLSTRHDVALVDARNKNNNESIRIQKIKIDYNSGKAGIDQSDQLSSYSKPVRKSLTWRHKVVTDILLRISVVNTLLLVYNMSTSHTKLKVTVSQSID